MYTNHYEGSDSESENWSSSTLDSLSSTLDSSDEEVWFKVPPKSWQTRHSGPLRSHS
jgi:hypothetical protein